MSLFGCVGSLFGSPRGVCSGNGPTRNICAARVATCEQGCQLLSCVSGGLAHVSSLSDLPCLFDTAGPEFCRSKGLTYGNSLSCWADKYWESAESADWWAFFYPPIFDWLGISLSRLNYCFMVDRIFFPATSMPCCSRQRC